LSDATVSRATDAMTTAMEGVTGRGPFRLGGAVLVAGGIVWLAHSALMMAGFLILAVSGGLNAGPASILTAFLAAELSLFAGIVAAVLLGVGSILVGVEAAARAGGPMVETESREAIGAIGRRAHRAGLSFLAFGVAGILAVFVLAWAGLTASNQSSEGFFDTLAAVCLLWAGGSVALVLAAGAFSDVLVHLHQHDPNAAWREPPRIRGYAYVNLVGVLLLAIPLLAVAASPYSSALRDLVCFLEVGGTVEGFVVPFMAILAFTNLVRLGLALTRGSDHERNLAP